MKSRLPPQSGAHKAQQHNQAQTHHPPMLNTTSGGIDYNHYCSPSGGIDLKEREPSPSGGIDPKERGPSPSGGIEGLDQPALPKFAELCIDCKDHAETISEKLRATLPKAIESLKTTHNSLKILFDNLGCPVAPVSACHDVAVSLSLFERMISLYTAKDETLKRTRPLIAMLSVRRIANEIEDIRNKDILETSLKGAIEALRDLIAALSANDRHMTQQQAYSSYGWRRS